MLLLVNERAGLGMIEMAAVVDACFVSIILFCWLVVVFAEKIGNSFLRFRTMRVITGIKVFPVRTNQNKYYEVRSTCTNLQRDQRLMTQWRMTVSQTIT
jgi:hypothetical protein